MLAAAFALLLTVGIAVAMFYALHRITKEEVKNEEKKEVAEPASA